ncbi:MAG: Thioredoxin [Firmicutes bacterium ADurb.Bin182]|nr:MAG: Thioredoxin [Firmicutes bacterium ADurb.Bin182]
MNQGSVVHLSSKDFDDQVLKADVPVLVDFWATWCGPCRMLGPIIEQLAEDYAGKAKICKLNVDENEDISMRYQVMSIPTVFVFANGNIVEKSVGLNSKQAYEQMLDKHL